MYETFSRQAPAVVTVNVEIPKDYLLQRWDESISKFRHYQEQFSDLITSGTDTQRRFYLTLESQIRRLEHNLEYLKQQMQHNIVDMGAGFAIDPHHVVTLTTVLRRADVGEAISITRPDNITIPAKVLGANPVTGIAMLRVEDPLFETYVDINRLSSRLPEASFIMTIQRPYRMLPSPFTGIICGYGRRLGLFLYEDYILTNLPLYPNNNGAPVFSASGLLIGMMASEFHAFDHPGVTFVIPANVVADSIRGIMKEDQLAQGWIDGVRLGQHQMGILIEEIERESRAALAGLRKDDLIVGVEGREINGLGERVLLNFYEIVMRTEPDQSLTVEVQRGPDRVQIEVPITERR